jgi:hypothetical protein
MQQIDRYIYSTGRQSSIPEAREAVETSEALSTAQYTPSQP